VKRDYFLKEKTARYGGKRQKEEEMWQSHGVNAVLTTWRSWRHTRTKYRTVREKEGVRGKRGERGGMGNSGGRREEQEIAWERGTRLDKAPPARSKAGTLIHHSSIRELRGLRGITNKQRP